ncbi:MAG TPA: hypothetical protein VIM10_08735 [Actinopolymorphaceae bacterium]|jgi:hypothetical protein
MGAFVVFDPYWDPIYAYATEAEARDHGADGTHCIWVRDASPGDCSDMPYTPKLWE